MKRVACSWSGGKDSCYALVKAVDMGYKPVVLLNVINENGDISRSHGIPLALLEAQAKAMNIPLVTIASTWKDYEANYIKTLSKLKEDYHLDGIVFGDIDIQSHRDWEEKVSKAANIEAILPLWQQDRIKLGKEIIDAGVESMLVSCNTVLGESFLGKTYTHQLMDEFTAKQVDECGENGEFHTLVVNCSLFTSKIEIPEFSTIQHGHYCFIAW